MVLLVPRPVAHAQTVTTAMIDPRIAKLASGN